MMMMQALLRVAPKTLVDSATRGLSQGSILLHSPLLRTVSSGYGCESFVPPVNNISKRHYSGKSWKGYDGEVKKEDDDDDEWNDAWESAWIPDESSSGKVPWEREDSSCSSFSSPWSTPAHPSEEEKEGRDATSVHNINSKMEQMTTLMKRITQVEEEENEDQQSKTPTLHPDPQEEDEREMRQNQQQLLFKENYLEDYRDTKKTVSKEEDYRLTKNRVHAALWLKEIQKQQEEASASLGGNPPNDDIDQLLDKCSQNAFGPSFGTVFFSGPIFAMVQMIRAVVEKARTSGKATSRASDHGVFHYILGFCLNCILSAMKFMNKFTINFAAITEENYFSSAKMAYELLRRIFFLLLWLKQSPRAY